MRKSGLTSGTMDHLRSLVAEKQEVLGLKEILASVRKDPAPPKNPPRRARREPLPPKQAWDYKEPDSERDIVMTVLQEETHDKDPLEESSGKLLKDTLKDMRKGPGITPKAPKKVKPPVEQPPQGNPAIQGAPWSTNWQLSAVRRYLAFLKKAYDIRNFYTEDSESEPASGPVAIHVSLALPFPGTVQNMDELEDYVSRTIAQTLNLGGEHHLIVTAHNGVSAAATRQEGTPVTVDLEGIDPMKTSELETLVQGLAVEAISAFADSKDGSRA
jgi:hypothetical protein